MGDEFYEKKAKEVFQEKSFQFKKGKDDESVINIIGINSFAKRLDMIVNRMSTIDTIRFALSFTRKQLEEMWNDEQAAKRDLKETRYNES